MSCKGYINSFQSLGALDGPGIRFVVFMQGCNLRCGCCHNPDTWSVRTGKTYSANEVLDRALRFREYFGANGGITVSGGEPLLQAEFVKELFVMCHNEGINTCLDTSGSILNDSVLDLLSVTDRVLLDVKYSGDELYKKYVGCGIDTVLSFLKLLDEKKISVTLRQVIIPLLNDDDGNIAFINDIANKYKCIDKIELLPFKKICASKYENMGLEFKFADFSEPTADLMSSLKNKLCL